MNVDNNSRLWKITKYYGRIREYRKGKLNDVFRQLEMFVYSLKRSRAWERQLVDECKY